jgi:hypothetical protein
VKLCKHAHKALEKGADEDRQKEAITPAELEHIQAESKVLDIPAEGHVGG